MALTREKHIHLPITLEILGVGFIWKMQCCGNFCDLSNGYYGNIACSLKSSDQGGPCSDMSHIGTVYQMVEKFMKSRVALFVTVSVAAL